MGNAGNLEGLKLISTPTQELLSFLDEWQRNTGTITAHTSGSTGAPKDIKLSCQDMIMSAKATCHYFGINENSLLGLPLSVGFIAGKMMAVRAMTSGARLYIESPSNRPLSDWTGDKISLLAVVPSQIEFLVKSGKINFVDNLLIGGAPLQPKQEQMLLDINFTEAHVSYGMTETCSHVALRRIGNEIYETLEGTSLSIDARGCLCITTPNADYSPVQTNDLVDLIDKHHFIWKGRYDNVVISGGIKFMPEVIERKIASVMQGRNYFMYGRRSDRWGQELVLAIEGEQEIPDLHNRLRSLLGGVEMPKAIIYLKEFERTNGKIKRPRT